MTLQGSQNKPLNLTSTPLVHGGDLHQATRMFGQPEQGWLDLSTGINPYAYPIPTIDPSAWQHLPYLQATTQQAAAHYYGTQHVLLTAGSQPVIEKLPAILPTLGNQQAVLVPAIGYQEHRKAWDKHTQVVDYTGLSDGTEAINQHLLSGDVGHLVIINPNNPTGIHYDAQQIVQWAQQLATKQGYVVVDEAFIDTTPALSVLANHTLPNNVIVLRSFGKFFGLAGIRVGVMIAAPELLQTMASPLGIWDVNGPAQVVATTAWQDQAWQAAMRTRLLTEQAQQLALWQIGLQALGGVLQADTTLFRSFVLPNKMAQHVYRQAAQQGILLRLITMDNQHSLVRMGNVNLDNHAHVQRCQALQKHGLHNH